VISLARKANQMSTKSAPVPLSVNYTSHNKVIR
jgi:hypothetical protein